MSDAKIAKRIDRILRKKIELMGGVEKVKKKSKKSSLKKSSAKKSSKTNPWISHVKKYAKKHKVTYGEALSLAGDSYKC